MFNGNVSQDFTAQNNNYNNYTLYGHVKKNTFF